MKRLIVSLILFAAVIAICFLGVRYVRASYEKINSELIRSEQCAKREDFKGAKEAAVLAEEIYTKREQTLAAFIKHDILDEVGVCLAAVPPLAEKESREEFLSSLAEAKVALTHIRNDHKFLLGNLF